MSKRIYTFKDLENMGVNTNTLKQRFYVFPEKYGVKNYEVKTSIKGIDDETLRTRWKNLIPARMLELMNED